LGNEKTAEVVLALKQEEGVATAQQLSASTGIAYSMVRDALTRLVQGGAIEPQARTGGSRSPLYYRRVEGDVWDGLVVIAQALCAEAHDHTEIR
jgi:predicted ArsR family transcriptional regulator